MVRKISGTKEWAKVGKNCLRGCYHNCRYCFAREMAIRFGSATFESWLHPVVMTEQIQKPVHKKKGTIMFPTTSDILPEFLEVELQFIEKLLKPGNNVLIVSKPHLDCIEAICKKFATYKQQILFRFTIGSTNDAILTYWEPNAPHFVERLQSLQCAFLYGYETSVSVEPMLDAPNIIELFYVVRPYVTNSIWIGKMNQIRRRVRLANQTDVDAVRKIEAEQTDDRIKSIYEALKDDPMVRWKESIKEVVGLPLAAEAGEDR